MADDSWRVLRERLKSTIQRENGKVSNVRFDTSDVVQDSLIQVWQKHGIDAEDPGTACQKWISMVTAGNVAKSYRFNLAKKRTVRRELTGSGADQEFIGADRESSPVLNAANRELIQKVIEAIEKMCPVHRFVFTKKVIGGVSFAIIASELDCSLHVVRKLYGEARTQLIELVG